MSAAEPSLVGILHEMAEQSPGHTVFRVLDQHGQATATLTAGGLAAASGALGARLSQVAVPGDRVLLPAMPGLQFHVAFMACLYARLVAVPVPPILVPSWTGSGGVAPKQFGRLTAICEDVRPAAAVVPGGDAAELATSWADDMLLRQVTVVTSETAVPDTLAGEPTIPAPPAEPAAGDELAFIQYTSGSTSAPHGVMITHRAMLANQAIIREQLGITGQETTVSWLPPYHDMGLCLGLLFPLYARACAVILAPETFLSRPDRWLRAVSELPSAVSAAPDFGYAWCARRTRPAAIADLDLSRWRVAVNGAEPVRADTLRAFKATFTAAGLSDRTMTPCYGLAESTLFVTGGSGATEPLVRRYDRRELGAGRALRAGPGPAPGCVELVGCGHPGPGVKVAIVDPETKRPCPPLAVGEIWVQSPSNGVGYWGRPEKSAQTFRARLADALPTDAPAAVVPGADGEWLRTGDLGFLDDGELFVTGRRKDIIVIHGANYYPQDFERLVQRAHQGLGGAAAAFTAGDGHRVIVVAETARRRALAAAAEAAAAAVRAVTAELPVTTDVVVVPRGQVPRTTSGKVRRQDCARRLRDGELTVLARWPRDPD